VTAYICDKDYKVGCDQSDVKDTLLEQLSTFLAVCQLSTEGYSLKLTSVTLHTYTTNDVN